MSDWQAAEKVQKNAAGEYRAMIGGQWVPVEKAQKNAAGEYRVLAGLPDRSLVDAVKEGVSNIPESAGKFYSGLAQAVANPIDTAVTVGNLGKGALMAAVPAAEEWMTPDLEARFGGPEGQAKAQQIMDTAKTLGGDYARAYGSWDGFKNKMATDPVGMAADISTILSLGAAGAAKVPGMARPTAALNTAAKYTNPMTPVVAAATPVASLVAKGTAAGYNALAPKASTYMTAVEGQGQEIVNALRNRGNQIVPGSLPTAAEAAASVGSTKFAALGDSAAKVKPTEYFARGEAQKAAQLAQANKVAGTPELLDATKSVRSATSNKLYGISDKAIVEADPAFIDMMNRPSMSNVMARARTLAAEEQKPFQHGKNVPKTEIAPGKFTPEEFAKYPGSSLHYMKMAFDDLINDPQTFGIGASEAKVIGDTRNLFLNWVEERAPSYRDARTTFAEQSKPINQMEVGQYIESKLKPALQASGRDVRSTGFAVALENAPGTLKKATGQSRFKKLTEVLTPDQMKILESVRDDLARAELAERQARAARGTGPGAGAAGTDALGGIRTPNMLNRVTAVANDLMRRLQGKLDEKLAIEIATEMLDPELAATAIEKAMARQAKGQKLAAPVKKVVKGSRAIMQTPGAVNALSTVGENQNAMVK
jgi:hypothetical protein